MSDPQCAFNCGRPLDMKTTSLLRWEVIGWVKKRPKSDGGGIHAIEMPVRTGAVAHSFCLDKAKRGIHPNQMSLTE